MATHPWKEVAEMVTCGSLLRRSNASPKNPSPVLDADDVRKIADKEIRELREAVTRAHEYLEVYHQHMRQQQRMPAINVMAAASALAPFINKPEGES